MASSRSVSVSFALVSLAAACAQSQPAQTSASPSPTPQPMYQPVPASAPAAAPAPTAGPAPATTGTAASAEPTPGKTPTATVSVGKPSVSGDLPNAEEQASAMESDFTRCYAEGLITDANTRGSVLLALQVGKDGAVTRADASPSGSVPANVQKCIRDRAQNAKFSAPKGGTAIVSFSVTLTPAPATETTTATASAGSGKLEEVAVSPPGFEHGEKVAMFVRAKARECYRDALRIDARAEGNVSVALWIDDGGKVTKVEALRTGTLPDTVAQCIQKRSKPAYFPKPKIAPTVVTVPIRLALKPAKPKS